MPRLALALAVLAATTLGAAAQPVPPAASPGSDNDGKTVSNPNLVVASVKMENGYRAGKVIGAAVYNDQNQQVGTVDDLILNQQNQVVLAVVSVGGFLGVGGKLIALPYENLKRDNAKILISNADKNTLATMPNFTYGP
jgi:sporulation protein YlmC with PRC-barrel domain